MKKRSFNYVRAYRTERSLSAKELAYLLGRDTSTVWRLEKTGRFRGRAAIACQVVFGVPPHKMFPELYEQVEEAVMNRAAKLHAQLDGKSDEKSLRKLALLGEMMKRATTKGLSV